MPLVLPFSAPELTLQQAGGKGLNLAALARADFAGYVPPGFIVTTQAYRVFVDANGLQSRIVSLAANVMPDDPVALEQASVAIVALFAQGHVPREIAQAVATAYADLVASPLAAPVAVRSSATAEDLPGLSFAGQQETYLNVVGDQAVLESVKQCWASLWTARAIGYRARNRIPPDEVALAVVVQQMIASETSGVLFSANPLTGHRGEIVIDASLGLGEAIVSGQVEPDHYVVAAGEWRITTRRLGAKALAIVPRAGGGTERVAPPAAGQPALDDEHILELARLGQRVAEHFRLPQDIEWAWAGGRLYLLQSRPITSLYPLPDVFVPPGAVGVFFGFSSIQGVTDPLTPLGRDALRLLLGGVILDLFRIRVPLRHALPEAGERLFLNFTQVVRHPQLRALMLAGMARADPAARQAMLRLIKAGRLPLAPQRPHGPPGFALLVLPRVMPHVIAGQVAPRRALRRGRATAERYLARVRERARLVEPGLGARLDLMESVLSQAIRHVLLPLFPAVFPAVALLPALDRWLVEWCGAPPGSALALMRGLPDNVTTEMDLKLWAAAQAIRGDAPSAGALRARPIAELVADYRRGALPAVAQRAVGKFLDEYGMRAVAEIDFARPRWREDPAAVMQTLCSYLDITDPDAAPDVVFRRGAAEAERLSAEYVARARRLPLGWVRAGWLQFIIGRMRALGGGREAPKFYLIQLLDVFRGLLLESARDLVAQGRLGRADDIFFVPLDELKQAAREASFDLKRVAAANRAAHEHEQTRRQVPLLLLSTGEVFYHGLSDPAAGANALVGEAVSPGVAEGSVRVVLDPRGTRLEPGEILVCPATDPGWTPLFLAAGGLVMEIGGMVTHGSVVAREYGIPAVVGVHNATTQLKTGQRVRVDGNVGRVTRLDS